MSRKPAPARVRKPARPPALRIELMVRSARWKQCPNAEQIVRKSIRAAAFAASTPGGELAIVLTDDSAIRALNRKWRGLDAPTNVLSFPASSGTRSGGDGAAPRVLGDVVIAYQTTAGEARAEGKPLEHHLAHLAVHGFLHLAGYDHDTERRAQRMERLEAAILEGLGVPDPYAPPPEA